MIQSHKHIKNYTVKEQTVKIAGGKSLIKYKNTSTIHLFSH